MSFGKGLGNIVKKNIQSKLEEIEIREGVRIVYACESGSRAWGFASSDSDWDVRFIYVRPTAWYLAVDLEQKRDVIELPLEGLLDINGWDLRKALGLLRKSNPPLMEWLNSPLIYREQGLVPGGLRDIQKRYFSARSSWHHYLHMAKGNFREFLQGDEVWLKKYFYVLRPLLAIRWLELEKTPVPTAFDTLRKRVLAPGALLTAIDQLLAAKMAGDELARGPNIPVLSDFIKEEFNRHQSNPTAMPGEKPPVEPFNTLFRAALKESFPAE